MGEDAERKKEIREIEKKEKELQEREKKLDEAAERLKMMDTFTTRDNIKVSSSENAQETFKRTSKVSRKRTRSKSPNNPGGSSRYHTTTYHSDQVKQGDRNIHAIDKSRRDQGNATGSRIVQVFRGKNFSSNGSVTKSKFPTRGAQRRGRGDRESGRFERHNREPHGQIASLFGNEERFDRGRDKLDEENQKRIEERLRKRLREKEEIIKQQKMKENGLKRKDEQSKKTWEK